MRHRRGAGRALTLARAVVFGGLVVGTASVAAQSPAPPPLPEVNPGAPALSDKGTVAVKRQNCGTFWTARVEDPEVDVNPCPKNCERGERQLVHEYKQGDKTLYEARYQCYRAAARPVQGLKPPAPAGPPLGSVAPEVGPWHTFARVTADRLASAEAIRVDWFPGDDDSQPQAGALTATVRKRIAPNDVEIEIPGDAGGVQGGVVRLMAKMPNQLQPVFIARFTVGAAAQVATAQNAVKASYAFSLAAGERTGWPLVIGRAGPVDVQVSAQGAALVLTLTHPGGRSEQQSGGGTLRLQSQATPEDVAHGQLWTVGLRPAGAAKARALRATRAPVSETPAVVASGSVTVSHPPGDARRAEGESAQRSQAIGGQGALNSIAALRTENVDLRLVGNANVQELQTRQRQRMQEQFDRAARQPAPATQAAITELSVSEGRPGDPVLIKGVGFGVRQGMVTFSVEPGSALAGTVVVWSDTAILVNVPDVSGLAQPFSGQLRVEGAASLGAPFRVVPAIETRVLVPQRNDMSLGNPSALAGNICHPACSMGVSLQLLIGNRGDDTFFRTARLRNGWKVVSVYLAHVEGRDDLQGPWTDNRADASIVEARVGSDSPYLKVHWWHDAFSSLAYVPRIVIGGPKGVPHQ